jgi:hypothetical protein
MMRVGKMLDKRDTNTPGEHAHSLQNALLRALCALRQIIGEEFRLLRGDTFAIECRDLRSPLLDQFERLAPSSLRTSQHPFDVRSSTCLLITTDTHSLNTNSVRASRSMLDGPGKDARWIVTQRSLALHG